MVALHQGGEPGQDRRPSSWSSRKEAGGAWMRLMWALCRAFHVHHPGRPLTHSCCVPGLWGARHCPRCWQPRVNEALSS